MGEGKLLATRCALTLAATAAMGAAAAQGPVYREHWGYLHLEARRGEVLRELAGRDAATHDHIAGLLAAPDRGNPFAPVANALAHLRGVEADAAFQLRTAIGAMVLPEVSDPDGKNEVCRTANVSVFVPFAIPFPAPVTFELTVRDAKDEVVWTTTIERDTGERDVRQARPAASVPSGTLPDGAYRVGVRTLLAGQAPRAHDPACAWTFHVLRGYQARAERAIADARALDASLPLVERAWVGGLCAQVHRAYGGEAFAVASDGVRDLLRLEQVLANVAAHRDVATGLPGDVSLVLPVAGGLPLPCVLRRAEGEGPRPLVVFLGGTPAYGVSLDRPAAPAVRDPLWLAHELAAFGRAERWHVAFLASPGVGRDYAAALREALPQLRQLVAVRGDKPLLVCEREAASIVGLRIGDYRTSLRGLVLVGSGAMAAPALQANGPLPVRLCALRGLGEDALARVIDYVALQQREGTWHGDVAWLAERRPAWPLGLPLLAGDIAAFARSLFPE